MTEVEYGLPDDEWARRQFDLVHTTMVDAGYKLTSKPAVSFAAFELNAPPQYIEQWSGSV